MVSYPCSVAHYFHAEVGAPELVPGDNCFQWLEVDRFVTDWCKSILHINEFNNEITTLLLIRAIMHQGLISVDSVFVVFCLQLLDCVT